MNQAGRGGARRGEVGRGEVDQPNRRTLGVARTGEERSLSINARLATSIEAVVPGTLASEMPSKTPLVSRVSRRLVSGGAYSRRGTAGEPTVGEASIEPPREVHGEVGRDPGGI